MKFSTILFIVIIMALTIICVRFLESYLNKKRRTTTVSLTPIIFLVLSIVLIIVYLLNQKVLNALRSRGY